MKKICNAATVSHFGNPKSNPQTHHTQIHLANPGTSFRDTALTGTHLSRSTQPLTWNIPTFQEIHSTFTHNLNSNIAQAGSCQNLKIHTPPSTRISYNGCRTARNLQIWATLCPPHRMHRIADSAPLHLQHPDLNPSISQLPNLSWVALQYLVGWRLVVGGRTVAVWNVVRCMRATRAAENLGLLLLLHNTHESLH